MIEGIKNNQVKSFIDDRGFLSQILPEGDESFQIKRIYSTGNFSRGIIRGFHKHMREKKAFFVPSGSAKFIAVDDRQNSSTFKEINTFVLSTLNPSVLTVPTGIYTGWMSLEDGTVVIGISSEKFDKDNPDDERLDPYAYGDVWKVKDR
ncbi:MAG: dTDP-4-dehydrorhamnose 3,5-epimerase family protein [Thaumarchaeota archaeon]|nr:dTDP-4-dehydrorhamnose 3,5-epimerase family protein [Nitrososphaerota archaeon]